VGKSFEKSLIAMKKNALSPWPRFVCAGCATRYNISLTNGDVITARRQTQI